MSNKSSSTTADKKPRTAAQIAASRSNGAKSKGPVTPEGKGIVCHNRMVHGFRSNSIALTTEDSTVYDAHLDAYLARYAPIDKTEEDLVGLLASSMWQIMRNNSIEVALFELEISGLTESAEFEGCEYAFMDEYGRLALAFKKSAGDNALELLRRYKSTAERAYHRALQAIEDVQRNRKLPPPEDFSTVQTQADSTAPPASPFERPMPPPRSGHTAEPCPPEAPATPASHELSQPSIPVETALEEDHLRQNPLDNDQSVDTLNLWGSDKSHDPTR